MINIPIQAVPNQSLSFESGENRYGIRIFSANGQMCCDVTINDAVVISSSRIMQGLPLIPYRYKSKDGNFLIVSDEEPDYRKFGVTQSLVFFS